MKTIEERIVALEKKAKVSVPGTILQRTLMQNSMCWQRDIKTESDDANGCTRVWTLGIGNLNGVKHWFHGLTIEDALKRAEAVKRWKQLGVW